MRTLWGMRYAGIAVLFLVGFVGLACGSDSGTEPDTVSMTGSWSGDWVVPPPVNGDRVITLEVVDVSMEISGSGAMWGPGDSEPYYTFTVSGEHAHPTIALELTDPTGLRDSLTGTFVDENTINATLETSLGQAPTTLVRQD